MPSSGNHKPRVLVVTPEIAELPPGMEPPDGSVVAKAGGMADVTAGLVTALFELGADVHVALPNYRRLFRIDARKLETNALRKYKTRLPDQRIHLAEDSIFYYRASVYGGDAGDPPKCSLRFQREIINHVVPEVNPDLIHCNDWMTGLIPAMARRLGIPCLFTVHNIHTYELTLAAIEESGIDPQEFWTSLYYEHCPKNYKEAVAGCRVDLLASGIFSAHFVNTVSPTFLSEVVGGQHDFVPVNVRRELRSKADAGCAAGILNAPPASFRPETDELLAARFSAKDHAEGKAVNKRAFQEAAGLRVDPDAPLFFWPSRLDPAQKGCELLTDILHLLFTKYRQDGIQVAAVADGPFQRHLRDIREWHGLDACLVVHDFDERLSHLGYAASDFVLMPSKFEPCGLPQMIGAKCGSLPIVHDTGGLHDTVSQLDVDLRTGNGFVFETYDGNGLLWAFEQAMLFHRLPKKVKARTVARIMTEAASQFNHAVTAESYFELYERMLSRPLVAEH